MSNLAEPQVMRWTTALYDAAIASGIFGPRRLELIEGVIIEMSPMTSKHAMVIHKVQRTLLRVVPDDHLVVTQAPLDLGEMSEPQPDVAIYAGSEADYMEQKPTHAFLVVEVADSSLSFDRGQKASLYAKAGIADYWIVNLKTATIEVYRTPIVVETQPYGYGYSAVTPLKRQDHVALLAWPSITIQVADLLP
jgi:Uma2 family endonuclease